VFDMVIGVAVGMVLAAFLFMHRMAEVTQTQPAGPALSQPPGPIPAGVIVYGIYGPLFFGAAQKAMATLEIVAGETQAVILLMNEVHAMDATGLVALESALEPLRQHKCLAILSGVRAQPMALIKKARLDALEGVVVCADPEAALAVANRHLERASTRTSAGASPQPASGVQGS
jgi:SulP family sulfate permease